MWCFLLAPHMSPCAHVPNPAGCMQDIHTYFLIIYSVAGRHITHCCVKCIQHIKTRALLFFNRAGSHQLSYSCTVPVLSAGMERGSPWLVALPGATITTCFKHGAPMVHTPARACTRYVHWPPEGRGHTTPALH